MVGAVSLAFLRPQVYNADYYAFNENPSRRKPRTEATETPWTVRRHGRADVEFATHLQALEFLVSEAAK